jgi:sensor domain CHASE-containing protein
MIASISDFPSARVLRAHWTVALIAFSTALLGSLAMIGWLSDQPALFEWRSSLRAMEFNTALACLLASIALGAWALRQVRFLVAPLGGFAALIGGVTLTEYLTGSDYGIDHLFHSGPLSAGVYEGRMSAVSALALLGLGLGLVLLGLPRRWRCPWIVGTLAAVVVSTATHAVLGDLLDLPGATHWGHFTRIAPHTAAGFAILGLGLFLAAWQIDLRPDERTPRWLPITLAVGVFAGALVLYLAVDLQQEATLARTLHTSRGSVERQIAQGFAGRAESLAQVAERWTDSTPPDRTAWEGDAARFTRDHPDVQTLEWIDPSGDPRWAVPGLGKKDQPGTAASPVPRSIEAMELARREHRPIFSGALELSPGEPGLVVYTPIQRPDGPFAGWIAAAFRSRDFLDRTLPPEIAADQSLRLTEHGHIVYDRTPSALPTQPGRVLRSKIEIPGVAWSLLVWPTPALTARTITPVPGVSLLVGASNALLLAGLCFFAQRYAREARARALAILSLQQALAEVRTLEGLLPICSCCKRVRDDTGYWNQIETYIHRRTPARFSHGYCPECAVQAFHDFGLDVPEHIQAEHDAKRFESAPKPASA